jgi:hypothetical protein
MDNIAERIKERRKALGFTQRDLAKLAKVAVSALKDFYGASVFSCVWPFFTLKAENKLPPSVVYFSTFQ